MNHISKIFTYLLMLCLFASSAYAQKALPPAAKSKSKELSEISRLIESLKKDLSQDRNVKSNLNKKLVSTQSRLNHVSSKLDSINTDLSKKKSEATALQVELNRYKNKLSNQQTVLATQVRNSFYMSRYNYADTLLSQKDPSEIQRALTLHKYLASARVDLIHDLNNNIQAVQSNKVTMLQRASTLQSLLVEQKYERKKLLNTKLANQKRIGQLNKTIVTKREKLSKLVAAKHNLEKIIKNLQHVETTNIAVGDKAFGKLEGMFPWPVNGRLQEHYGSDIDQSGLKSTGVLIATNADQTVRAISKGKVVFANWMQGFGLMMIIDHGNNYMSLYGNNKNFYKKQGDTVELGEIITTVGNSGIPDQTGLYFEIRHKGIPVNPERWCRTTNKT